MPGVNWADVIGAIAEAQPEATAQVQGDRRFTWAELDRRSDRLGRRLLDLGLARQDKVAQYLYNGPEYMESVIAACKASLVPVNTNYRYLDDELVYLWDNADVAAVVFHGCLAGRVDGLRHRLARVRAYLWVDDGSGPCPDWAIPYEEATGGDGDDGDGDPARTGRRIGHRHDLAVERDGDDLVLIYTGGTTGMPKGVMWRQDDYFQVFNRERAAGPYDTSRGRAGIGEARRREGAGRVSLPACPQMHSLGLLGSVGTLLDGGTLVTLERGAFGPVRTLDLVERERVEVLYIVGDAFARPLLEALDAEPGRWDLSSLVRMRSAGVMWSEEVKRGLLRHHPDMLLHDGLGSTEAVRAGRSESQGTATVQTGVFQPGPFTLILDDELEPIPPGSRATGRLAVGGNQPVGYYKDPEKTARTFVEVRGERYVIPGDWAAWEDDGSIRLLGRGSLCINTGGEKVFPEEVEEALETHPGVRDAACVGVPHPRFGEVVTAVVELRDGHGDGGRSAVDEAELIAWVKERLAHYKAPRHVLFVATVGRAANGKVDYRRVRQEAIAVIDIAR
jgi:fatty-acyl-CoA synthase